MRTAALVVLSFASPAALAASLGGNVSAASEYVFRGVEQSNGAAVQGGLDYVHDTGAYAGLWVSNTDFAATDGGTVSSEFDLYAGYATRLGELDVDAGLIGYFYPDDGEFNTVEFYAGAGAGPASLRAYYTGEYFSTGEAGYWVGGKVAWPLAENLKLVAAGGWSGGDGPKLLVGDEYFDYTLGVSRSLDGGLEFGLVVTGTNLDTTLVPDDKPKFVVSIKQSFDLFTP